MASHHFFDDSASVVSVSDLSCYENDDDSHAAYHDRDLTAVEEPILEVSFLKPSPQTLEENTPLLLAGTSIPWASLIALCAARLVDPIAFTQVFP